VRTGARSPSLVPADVIAALEAGQPSVNHMEQIAIDMGVLLCKVFPIAAADAERLRGPGLVKKMAIGGQILYEHYGRDAWGLARSHPSDTVRGWGAMAIAAEFPMTLAESLNLMLPFADDPHFAVREWAWLAQRRRVIDETEAALAELGAWARANSPRVRRFASEVTRPRGVWSAHIPELKAEPGMALELLDLLRADPSPYVQDSVGNWLNDASKSKPDWVREVCAAWSIPGSARATERICRRALRSIGDP